jgi:F420H(2)-dependent quinone reductase
MANVSDWNAGIVQEFRANYGRVGGNLQGAPLVLLHHRGRKSGREFINPLMYLTDENDDDVHLRVCDQGRGPGQPRLVLQPHYRWRGLDRTWN